MFSFSCPFLKQCVHPCCVLSVRLFLVLYYHHFLSSRYAFLFSSCQISIYICVNARGMCCNLLNNLLVSTLYVSENKEPLFFYAERGETKFYERKCLNLSAIWVTWATRARSQYPTITFNKGFLSLRLNWELFSQEYRCECVHKNSIYLCMEWLSHFAKST